MRTAVSLPALTSILGIALVWSGTRLVPANHLFNNKRMTNTATLSDTALLVALNKRFIENFIRMDTVAHNELIHRDFVCINGDGSVSARKEYMEGWSTGYATSGYTSFGITDENIRIFRDMALVRSKTVYTRLVNGETVHGYSIYTDTYIKENGRWWCVQAHITPVKK